MFVIHAIFKMVLLLRGKNICQFPSIGGELEKMDLQVSTNYMNRILSTSANWNTVFLLKVVFINNFNRYSIWCFWIFYLMFHCYLFSSQFSNKLNQNFSNAFNSSCPRNLRHFGNPKYLSKKMRAHFWSSNHFFRTILV